MATLEKRPIVGYWIQFEPKLKKPTDEELALHFLRVRGLGPPGEDHGVTVMSSAMAVLFGIADQRCPTAHMVCGALPIWRTRAKARRVAVASENEYWSCRVRVARMVAPGDW